MRISAFFATLVLGALLATSGVATAAVELVQNGGFETTTYTQSHQIGVNAPTTGGGNQGVSQWTGTEVGCAPSGCSGSFNILFHPTTSAAPGPGVSGYGVTYNQNNTGTGALSGIEPITQYGGETQLLSQGCGVSPAFSCASPPGPSPFVLSPNGGNFLAMDGDSVARGEIQQTIDGTGLINGHWYTLSFYWAATQLQNRVLGTTADTNTLNERLDYRLGTQTFSTSTITQTNSHTFSGWQLVTNTFQYTGPSGTNQTLAFLSVGTPTGRPPVALLDGVSLTDTPEPATMALLSIGVAGLIFARRPNRRRVAG